MNKERLLKMVEFLEVLPPHKFDFGHYVVIGSKSPADALAAPEEHCGTTACAVGWMPAIFPDVFSWSRVYSLWSADSFPCPINRGSIESWADVEMYIRRFLDLTNKQYAFLFIPGESPLRNNATATQVAQQIKVFITTEGENMHEWEELYRES